MGFLKLMKVNAGKTVSVQVNVPRALFASRTKTVFLKSFPEARKPA
jgi:hypothetical protein